MKWVIDIPDDYDLSKIKHGSIASNNILQAVKAGKPFKERPRGEWILVHPLQEDDGGAYMCSICKTGDWNIRGDEHFCPNCGSDNRPRKRGLRAKMGLIDDAADENPNFKYLKVGDTIYTQDDDKQGWTGREGE